MYDPDLYDKYSEFQRRDAREFIPCIVSKMTRKPTEVVLDLGCGSGFNTKNILYPALSAVAHNDTPASFVHVYAIDVSKKMVDFACIRYAHPQITYTVADVMKDETEFHCTFDKIFSLHVLHWIVDQRKALRRLHDLLKANGEIAFYYISKAPVFSVYDMMSRNPKWAPFLSDVAEFIPKSYFSKDPAKDMYEMMTSIGYHVQESSNHTRKFRFDSVENMIDAAMAANPFVHKIPAELKSDYKEDFRKCFMSILYFAPSRESPNAVEVDYSIVLVRAQKRV